MLAASMLVASMQLLPSYVTNYYFLVSCYAHMGRHDDATEIFRRLTLLTTPVADPPVIMPQRPEQRAFFPPVAGWRWARRHDRDPPPRRTDITEGAPPPLPLAASGEREGPAKREGEGRAFFPRRSARGALASPKGGGRNGVDPIVFAPCC